MVSVPIVSPAKTRGNCSPSPWSIPSWAVVSPTWMPTKSSRSARRMVRATAGQHVIRLGGVLQAAAEQHQRGVGVVPVAVHQAGDPPAQRTPERAGATATATTSATGWLTVPRTTAPTAAATAK